MFVQQIEEQEFTVASESEVDRDDAVRAGADRPDAPFLVSNRDAIYRNPYYRGPWVAFEEL